MEIPVSPNDLNEVIYNVARDVVEQRAIDGKIEEITEDVSNEVLDEVIFVVERYMYYVNSLMDTAKLAQAKSIFETQSDFE
jgi:preprotein translocase subunit SecA